MSRNFTDVMAYWGGKEKSVPKPQNRTSKKQAPQQKSEEVNNINTQPQSAIVIVLPIPNVNNNNDNVNQVSPDVELENADGTESTQQTSTGYNNFKPSISNSYDNNNKIVGEAESISSNPLMDSVKTSYNSSNYGGGTSNYGGGSSLYGASMYGITDDRRKAYLLDDEDESYYGEEDDDDSSCEKKSYIETDISENDLQSLENMLLSTSISMNEGSEIEIASKVEEMKKNTAKFLDQSNPVSNPYISGNTVPLFINSAYKDSSFLTDSNGLSSSSGVSKDTSNVETLTSWNSEFQKLIEMDDCLEKFERLSSLEHDFVYASETYGRIIISEHFLPIEFRTIKPVTVGGIAGGEKYIVQGILFKFAVENETFGLYGNDENAMKTAAHELNGCTSFLNVGVKGLHVPLMAYIDYRGFRLVAMSLLPISKKSLIYGSSDAGQTVHTSNTLFNHLFSTSAKIVNLKSHVVQDMNGEFKNIHGPIDIEGHIGTDNRFYLLDFARLSPPEPPTHRGSYLYKLLRLEFVRTYTKPLCSDAFSPMINIDIENHNADVKEAYEHLLTKIIPKMGETIDQKNMAIDFVPIEGFAKLLHSEGINVRLMGYIYKACATPRTMIYILVEAIVRSLKSLARELLRREMKKTHLPSDYPYRLKILNFLNLIFGQYKDATQNFWENILFPKLLKKFKGIEPREVDISQLFYVSYYKVSPNQEIDMTTPLGIFKTLILTSPILRCKIFEDFVKSIGLRVTPVAKNDFRNHSGGETGFLFVDPDIVELSTIITRLNIIDYADGMSLYYKSLLLKDNTNSKSRLLSISKSRLEQSLSSMSTNYAAIYQLGNVIRLMSKFDEQQQTKLLELAETTYLSLEKLRIEPNLLFQSKICRCKTIFQRVKGNGNAEDTLFKLEQIEKEIAANYSNFKGSHIPSYVLAKALVFNCSYKTLTNYASVIQKLDELLENNPKDYKSHITKAAFYLNCGDQIVHKEIDTRESIDEKIGFHLKISLNSNPSLVKKLDRVMLQNCWKIFQYGNDIPILQVKIRDFLQGFNNALVIPKDTKIINGELLSGFAFESFKMVNSQSPETVVTILTVIDNPNLKSINISGLKIDTSVIPNVLQPMANHLVKLNLGKCDFVNDSNLSSIISPTLKNLKIYNNLLVSDQSLDIISSKCLDIEVLDLGACELFTPDSIDRLIVSCKKIRKLALPKCTTNTNVNNALVELTSLASLDLMNCTDVSREFNTTAFTLSTSLKKLRDEVGVPHFLIPKQTNLSFRTLPTLLNMQERVYNCIWETEKLMMITLSIKTIPFHTKVYTFYYHAKHPLVKFRDSPLDRKHFDFIKIFHTEKCEKPIAKLEFFRSGTRGQQHLIRLNSNLQVANFQFHYDFTQYIINIRIVNSMNLSYYGSLNDTQAVKIAQFTNTKLAKTTHDAETLQVPVHAQVLLTALSCCMDD